MIGLCNDLLAKHGVLLLKILFFLYFFQFGDNGMMCSDSGNNSGNMDSNYDVSTGICNSSKCLQVFVSQIKWMMGEL